MSVIAIVLIVLGIVVFVAGLVLWSRIGDRLYSRMLYIGLIMGVFGSGLLGYNEQLVILEEIESFVVERSNELFNVENSYIVNTLEKDKYEVVADDLILHAYVSGEETLKVKFLEIGLLQSE
jgi:hypothetical protein